MFNPGNWYWVQENGSVFSSAKRKFYAQSNADFKAWLAEGNIPTQYPRDETGNQSEDELAATLLEHGVFIRPKEYAAAKRYTLETGGYVFRGHRIATDRESRVSISGMALGASLLGDQFSTSWKCADGSFITLDAADALALATEVMAFVSACFGVESEVSAGIASGDITSIEQVDHADWPSNVGASQAQKN